MWDRLLFAIDQFESGQTALDFVADVASANDASVRVLHIRDVPRMAHAVPLESPADAEELVRSTVQSLTTLGVAAEGRSSSVFHEQVARRIIEESLLWECQAIVLGSRRVHGLARLSGHGMRERILRGSSLPVLVAPAPEHNGIHWPPRFRSERERPATHSDRGTRHARLNPRVHGTGTR